MLYSYNPYYADYISHHGIQGQKWGVRRYQNPDGSLTAAGRKRYNLPFYGDREGKEKTLFYGTRKRQLMKESMNSTKGSGMSKSERKKQAKEYANKELEKKYGESNKTYKKIDTAVNVVDKIDKTIETAAAAMAIGSVAFTLVSAKANGIDLKDIGIDVGKETMKNALKMGGKMVVAGLAVDQGKKLAVKAEDKYYGN